VCEIRGSHSGLAEDTNLLGCDVVSLGCLILNMKALRSSETSGTTHPTTQCYVPDDLHLQVSPIKRRFVVTHTVRQTDIPALLDSCVTNTPSVKMLCSQTNCLSLHIRKDTMCLSVGLLRIGRVFCLLKNCVSVGYDKLLFRDCCVPPRLIVK
jgi:hypothetical protein